MRDDITVRPGQLWLYKDANEPVLYMIIERYKAEKFDSLWRTHWPSATGSRGSVINFTERAILRDELISDAP